MCNFFIKNMSNKGVICPNCGVIKFDVEDVENIEEFGECCICESIRTDLAESQSLED
jgi:hypothetical protein